MLDEQVGRVRATVTSAVPLDDAQLQRLRDTLSSATRKSIVLESKTDPSLVGGVVAQVGARQYDGSIRTQLERLREELKESSIA
jgi:F-type H+-transporting ATPase subunit delta